MERHNAFQWTLPLPLLLPLPLGVFIPLDLTNCTDNENLEHYPVIIYQSVLDFLFQAVSDFDDSLCLIG